MQICAKRAIAAEGIVFPSQSGPKPHKAYAWKEDAPELNGCFCSCQAFIFGRSKIAKAENSTPQEVTFVCKHLQQVFDNYCGWRQTSEGDYRFDRICPDCGGEVIDTDDQMVPTDTAGAVNDLQRMLAEMSGEEPPPLLDPERPFTVTVDVTWTEKRTFTVMARDEDSARVAAMDTWTGHPVGTDQSDKTAQVVSASEGEAPPQKPARKPRTAKPVTDPAKAAVAAKSLAATVAPRKRTA